MCCNEGHGHHHSRRHGGQCDEGGHGECGCGHHGERDHDCCQEHQGGHECGCGHHDERDHDCCQEHQGGHECGCGDRHGHGICCGEGEQGRHFRRRFHTREERLAGLEEYLKDLQAEVKAVEEQIAELKVAQ